MSGDPGPLIEARDLCMHFTTRRAETVKAVDGVSLSVRPGETLGIIGESGSGKSTLARMLAGLARPTAGTVRYQGSDMSARDSSRRRARGGEFQMIFQDPHAALNPRMRVLDSVLEPLRIARRGGRAEQTDRALRLLERVGVAQAMAHRYPHELSGGQKQRVNIARALTLEPRLLICDEATAGLDVSIQAGILNLLLELQQEIGLTYVLITHDLTVAMHMSDRLAVMYLGRFMEYGAAHAIGRHPYTRALLSAEPVPLPSRFRNSGRIVLTGEIPNAIAPPSGCRFRTRCPQATPLCAEQVPQWRGIGADHFVACHYATGDDGATGGRAEPAPC
jgi:oligopeptide/dipeptide ABC transporter ATP-binding protein